MNTTNLPINLACTEDLKYELNKKIEGITDLLGMHLMYDSWNNSDEPDEEYTEAEINRFWDMVIPFEDECRDNFLRIPDERMAGRYCYLLRQYFAFMTTASQQLKEYETTFWDHVRPQISPGVDNEEWYNQNENTYLGTLIRWTTFIFDEFIPDIQQILDTYNSYFLDRSVTSIIAPNGPMHAVHFPVNEQRSPYQETKIVDTINDIVLPPMSRSKKDSFVMKEQILLLNELGIFNIPAIKMMTTENQGILFAKMFNLNEKNVTETIRNCDGHKRVSKEVNSYNPYSYPDKIRKVEQLLDSVRFKKEP